MDVVVTVKKWGKYSKGDVIKDMPESTAKACIKANVVEENKPKSKSKKK